MLYRRMNDIDEKLSLLGFGGMRFPLKESGEVDEDEAIRLIRRAIDSGVNYVDTGYTYHGGKSEVIIGRALGDGYREKVFLADKLPIWLVKKEEDVSRYLEEQLERLGVDCIDMYLIHCIDEEGWATVKNCRVLPRLEELKAEGKIGHIGFSFHDQYPLFEEVIDAYPWEFCQIQLNYMDREFQAGLAGLRYAARRGIPVVIMEPLKGGRLTDSVPDVIREVWDRASRRRTPAEWAFSWVAAQSGVVTILSGMSSAAQLEENLRIFSDEHLADLSEEDLALIDQVADLYRQLIIYPCTECRYCMPCPSGVLIPRLIRYYNDWCAYDQNPKLKEEYLTWQDPGEHAVNCVKCGKCEEACPQHLPVMEIMGRIVEAFGR